MKKSVYVVTRGAQFDAKRVQVYGREIGKLGKGGNEITPQKIVTVASDSRNPLHECFDWDNKTAGDKWRLVQARNLLNHIEVEVVGEKGEPYRAKAWVHVDNEYTSHERLMTEDDKLLSFVEQLIVKVEYWQNQCSFYYELARIFGDVKTQLRSLKKKMSKVA